MSKHNDDKFNKKLVNNLTTSFVNDYLFWKNIITNTNETIETLYNNTSDAAYKIFSYDEFCSTFIEHVKEIKNVEHFTQDNIQVILLEMIRDKKLD